MKPTVFLGAGRITNAVIAGLRLAKYKGPIVVHDRHPEKLRSLRKLYEVAVESDLQKAVRRAGVLIVAVRPASVRDLLDEIGEAERPLLAISLAAGVPLSRLRAGLGDPVRWARAMPSPVSRNGRGLIAVTFPRGVSSADRRKVIDFFAKVGKVVVIPEAQFDAFTVTYSSSHGYHALATLAQAGEKVGLDRKTALMAAAHALSDGIACWREGRESLEALMREAQTPGGIAATVIDTMDDGGYCRLVEKALRAGRARARANKKL